MFAVRFFILLLIESACIGTRSPEAGVTVGAQGHSPAPLVDEHFDQLDAVHQTWLSEIPGVNGATVSVEDGTLRMTLPSSGEIKLTRQLDAVALRGMRLHVRAKLRTDSTTASARLSWRSADATLVDGERLYAEPVSSDSWTVVDSLVDVETDSRRGALALVVSGQGNAWFDDVRVDVVGPTPSNANVALSAQQLDHLQAFTRAATLIRYRHPSDQSADLDWNQFLPAAIDRILQTKSRKALLDELRALFGTVAPTVEFSESPKYSFSDPERNVGAHLARWQRVGFGVGVAADDLYRGWRQGRDRDLASIYIGTRLNVPHLSQCKRARVEATGRRWGEGEAKVYAMVFGPGRSSKQFDIKLHTDGSSVAFDVEIPATTFGIDVMLGVEGNAGASLQALSLVCNDHERIAVDIARAGWTYEGTESFYSHSMRDCPSGTCLVVDRVPLETSFVRERDVLSVEIAAHLWAHVPLAVWTDSHRTFPVPAAPPWRAQQRYGATELPSRLAVVAAAWGTLSLFYPYFADQHLDWLRELQPSFVEMAAAHSIRECYRALFALLARLHDNHARARHPSVQNDGILPLALRPFDNALIVVGTLDDYAKKVTVGSEVLSINGVAAPQVYADMLAHTSSATQGWSDAIVPFWLTVDRAGTLADVRVKSPDGITTEVLLPHLARKLYEDSVHEPRPAIGAELRPGIYYLDLDRLTLARWQAVLPSLAPARTVILDMRGYPNNAAFEILGHFVKHEIVSPLWRVPLLGTSEYAKSSWTIRPMTPSLDAKVIMLIDGRAISAAETVIQTFHDNAVGPLVGESSAGTNGDVALAKLPAGFSIQFTGLRVQLQDGAVLQARGITPDVVVHPTLAGVRAGRDEVLEAALQLASHL
jgi:hypothetical protein